MLVEEKNWETSKYKKNKENITYNPLHGDDHFLKSIKQL